MDLSRREVLFGGALGAAGLTTGNITMDDIAALGQKKKGQKFQLKYAPHFGMFRNHAQSDIDQLKFAADEGFTAWEDNGMSGRPVAEQEKLASAMSANGLTMGVFVVNLGTAWDITLTSGKQEPLDKFLGECKVAVECAKRVNAKWMTVVPGLVDPQLDNGYQTANVIEALRRAAAIFEPHGLVMVLEALNYRDHPNLFLNKIAQGYMICRAVNSPSCKLLFDCYHQQIHEGNLIPNANAAWSEIGYFQMGDNPGRREPLTGEINYRNVFKNIAKKGYTGVLGMEHGIEGAGKEGERQLINRYRWCDDFTL